MELVSFTVQSFRSIVKSHKLPISRSPVRSLRRVTVHSRLTEVRQADWRRVLEPPTGLPRSACRCIFDVDNTVATAMIDRLMQHGDATDMQSDSFRTKDTQEAT
jgi:hypothetical protein